MRLSGVSRFGATVAKLQRPTITLPTKQPVGLSEATKYKGGLPLHRPMNQEERVAKLEEGIESGDAHFAVGKREVWFPKEQVIFVRPNAKLTPYQASFLTPLHMNKMELRDYLYNVYGLRALNVRSVVFPAAFDRENASRPRYRKRMIKKMTIEMEEPFVWPEDAEGTVAKMEEAAKENKKMQEHYHGFESLGSNREKPAKAFGGMLGPYRKAGQPFVTQKLASKLGGSKRREAEAASQQEKMRNVAFYLAKNKQAGIPQPKTN
ncbi:54S ribosomal protein L41 [Yarrowia sp. C11]|nr:54S ribosomal protein L41 [Yarrowia sp. E02]KAG5371821.1 54S ribosomal protein L41 [Yarrowia sp. C11]